MSFPSNESGGTISPTTAAPTPASESRAISRPLLSGDTEMSNPPDVLGIAQKNGPDFIQAVGPSRHIRERLYIPASPARGDALYRQVPGPAQQRDSLVVDNRGHMTRLEYGPKVSEESEAGDVGAGVDPDIDHHPRRFRVQRTHHTDRIVKHILLNPLLLAGRRDHAGPNRLSQYEGVSHPSALGGDLLTWLDDAGDGQAILRLVVVHGMPSHDQHARLKSFVRTASEHAHKDVLGKVDREADDVERGHRPPAHGVDVAEGVGRGYLSERVGVVDDGREEVDCRDQG